MSLMGRLERLERLEGERRDGTDVFHILISNQAPTSDLWVIDEVVLREGLVPIAVWWPGDHSADVLRRMREGANP